MTGGALRQGVIAVFHGTGQREKEEEVKMDVQYKLNRQKRYKAYYLCPCG
jgi:hypothetical protein